MDFRIDWETVECLTSCRWSNASGGVALLWNVSTAPTQPSLSLELQRRSVWIGETRNEISNLFVWILIVLKTRPRALSYTHLWRKCEVQRFKFIQGASKSIFTIWSQGKQLCHAPCTPTTHWILLSAAHIHFINSWLCVWPKMNQPIRKSALITFKNRWTHSANAGRVTRCKEREKIIKSGDRLAGSITQSTRIQK